MNIQIEPDTILTETGEATELATPSDFGKGLAFLNPSEFPDLDNVEVGISIKPDYLEFVKAGDSVRGVFNGIGEITTKDRLNQGQYKTIPAAVLQTKEGLKLNAGANLVNQLRNIQPGTAIQITYKGKESTSTGNEVKTYDVRLLNVPHANVSPITVSRPSRPALSASVSNPEPHSFDEENPVEIVPVLSQWAVEAAADAWNISVYEAAVSIGKKLTGSMEKTEFLNWLQDPK